MSLIFCPFHRNNIKFTSCYDLGCPSHHHMFQKKNIIFLFNTKDTDIKHLSVME